MDADRCLGRCLEEGPKFISRGEVHRSVEKGNCAIFLTRMFSDLDRR